MKKQIRTRILTACFIVLALTYHKNNLMAQVSNNIPSEDPIYDRVERLHQRGLFKTGVVSFRPITETYLIALLKQAIQRLEEKAPEGSAEDSDIKAITAFLKQRGYLKQEKQNGFANAFTYSGIFGTNSQSVSIPEMGAEINPLLEQRDGRWQQGGIAGWTELELAARWFGWGALKLRTQLPLQWTQQQGGGSFRATLYSGALKLGHGDFEIQLGRFPVRWGHAMSGGLLLSGSQKPLDALQVRNTVPTRLPWLFKYLGPIQYSFLVSRLSDVQHFPNSFLVGNRITILPAPWLELGYAQTVVLGGKGAPDISFGQAISESLGRRSGDVNGANRSNRNFLFDYRLTIPPLHSIGLYGEFYLEDCCGGQWLRDMSNLAGVELPQLWKKVTLNFEWVRTTEITYRNGTFQTGFADRNHLLGHSIGPDAMGFYLFTRYRHCDTLWFQFRTALERRGRNEKNQGGGDIRTVLPSFDGPEERWSFVLTPTWDPTGPLWIRASVGYEYVNNFRFEQSSNRNHGVGMIEVGWNF